LSYLCIRAVAAPAGTKKDSPLAGLIYPQKDPKPFQHTCPQTKPDKKLYTNYAQEIHRFIHKQNHRFRNFLTCQRDEKRSAAAHRKAIQKGTTENSMVPLLTRDYAIYAFSGTEKAN